MHKHLSKLLLILFISLLSLFSSQRNSDDIAKISAVSLYNIDKNALQTTLKEYIKNFPTLKALKVVESLSAETFISVFVHDGQYIYNKKLPTSIKQFNSYTSTSKFGGEKVGQVFAYFDEPNKLNQKEISWIKNNPSIKIAVMHTWKPFDMTTKGNVHFGFHSDIAKLINEKLSTDIVLVPFKTWGEAYKAVLEGEVDAINSLSWTKQREKEHFIYSPAYHFTPYQIVVKKDNMLSTSLNTLKNKSIAVRTKSIVQKIIEEEVPSAKINFLPSEKEAYLSVQKGKSYATLIANANEKLLAQYNLKIASQIYHKAGEIYIGTNKNFPLVASIIKKGLNTITLEEMAVLRKKWFESYLKNSLKVFKQKVNEIKLTEEEQVWIKKHPKVKIAIQDNWAPLNYLDELGVPKGLGVDFIELLNKRLNGILEIHPNSFKNNLQNLKDKKIDAMLDITPTQKRKEFYHFTTPYITIPKAIVAQKNSEVYYNKEEMLFDKKVAIEKGYLTAKILKEIAPGVTIVDYDNTADALDAVSRGDVDAYVGNKAVVNYILRRDFITNLTFHARTKNKGSVLAIGVRKDWIVLRDILQKALNTISVDERNDILNKYITKTKTKQKKELNIAFHFDRPPYMFGKTSAKGIEVDLVKEIFELQGYKINIHQMTKATMEKLLQTNPKFDAVASVTDKKDGSFYSDKYSLYEDFVITRKADDIKINSMEDLAKHNFVSWKNAYNDLGETFYKYFNPKDGLYKSKYHDRVSQKEQHKLFFDKKTKVIVVDKLIFKWYKLDFNQKDEYTFHKILPLATNAGIQFREEKYRDIFNDGLKKIKKSGRYDEIVNFYLTQDMRPLLKYSNLIADISGRFLFDDKTDNLAKVLSRFLEHPDIAHLKIFNTATNNDVISLHKQKDKVESGISHSIHANMPSISKEVFYSDDGHPINVGSLQVYYKKDFKLNEKSLIPKLELFDQFDKNDLDKIKKSYEKFSLISKSALKLTPKEKAFVKKHPIIKVHNEKTWAPYNFYDRNRPRGLSIDYIKLLAKKAGLKIKFITGPTWNEFTENIKKKELDVMLNIAKSKQREAFLNFTEPYTEILESIFIKNDATKLAKVEDLYGKTFAIPKGFYYEEKLKKHPNIKLLQTKDTLETIRAVSIGKADAFIDINAVVNYYTKKHSISNITDGGTVGWDTNSLPLHMGIRKDWPELVSILNKALHALSDEEIDTIENKWLFNSVSKKTKKIALTFKEKKWILENKIKVGVEQWAPVVFSNTGNDIDGISGDILKLVIEKTGLNIEIINDLWEPLLNDFKNKKIDLLPATYYTDERATYGLYSKGYYKMLDYIYVKEDNYRINSMSDLNGKTLAIPKGFGTIPKIKKKFPNIKIVNTIDLEDSIKKVLSGEIEALYDGQIAVQYKIQDQLISGLKGISQNDYKAAQLHFFSKMDEPILQSILQKALHSITFEEKRNVMARWVGENRKIRVTKSEQTWLDKKIPIKYVYDPDWAPFEWKSELEQHFGMISDILNIVAQKSGIEFTPVSVDKWSDAVIKAKKREVDMYSGINQTDEKSTYMQFTKKSIYKTPYVFVTRANDNSDYFETFDALKNKRVAVVEDYSIHDTLKKEQPLLPLLTVKSTKEGFEKIKNNSMDVFVVNAATAKYYINRMDFEDLRIATKTKYNLNLKVAIRNDWPEEVVSIIDKALATISKKDLSDIHHKWTAITVEEKTDWTLVFQIVGLGFLVIGFGIYTNHKLKRKVTEKTSELTALLGSFDENVIASKTDLKGIITYASKAFCEISGYTHQELIGQPQNIVRHVDMPKAIFQDLWQTIKNGDVWRGDVKNATKEGSFYWVATVITPEFDSGGNPTGYGAIRHDITSQKEVEEQTKILNQQNKEMEVMLQVFDEHIISSKSDLEGHITSASKALSEISGYTIDELIGQQHSIMRHPDMGTETFEDLWATIQSGQTWKGEIKNLKKDGGYFWVEALVDPEFNDEGDIVGYSAIRQDITSKKEVEELSANLELKVEKRTAELNESEKRFVTLFDAAPDSIAIIKDGQYISCNQKTLELFGVSTQEEFINSVPSDFSPQFQENGERSDLLAPEKINLALEKGYTLFEWKHKRCDTNKVFDAEVILSSIKLNNEPHVYAVVRDITQRKLLEKEIAQNKQFLDALLDSQEQIVITTDGKKLRSVNKKFLRFFNIESIEEYTKDYDCICDKFKQDNSNSYLQKEMNTLHWIDYVIEHEELSHRTIIVKNGIERTFSVTAAVMPIENGSIKSAVFTDITELENQKKQTDSILASVLLPMLITSKKTRKIVYANSFAEKQYESTLENIVGSEIDIFYTSEGQKDSILKEMTLKGTVENFETRFKTFQDNEFDAILSLIEINYGGEECFLGVASDITEQKNRESVMQKLHKNITDSIEYASLIQHSLIPENENIKNYFQDFFTIWYPKDIVGGDIYLFEELRDENECLLMVIDCTGHGVPGAFVTMLVKAIERQVIADIQNSDKEVSPAAILEYFNKTMKKLLRQEDNDSISNAGFDGGVLYYNRSENILRYAGAETPLFYVQNDELKIIKSDRHSIGYKKSDAAFQFTDHEINIDTQTRIYVTTDGYFDQNGGEKGFPFGKKRFKEFIQDSHNEKFADQKELLLYEMQAYQKDEERNDDITVIGLNVEPFNNEKTKKISWDI